MFSGYILLAFLFMGLLFVRHILIYKEVNKINYAPLVMTIGLISSIIHFITYPENKDLILLIRESLFPLVVSLFLYIVMNILHQTQIVEQSKLQLESTHDLIYQISELKTFSFELEKEMLAKQEDEIKAQQELREKFHQDIKALEIIQVNQMKFLEKFDEMNNRYKDITNRLDDFTDVRLPALNDIVHKHIEVIKISEKEYFNNIRVILEKALEHRCDLKEDVLEVKEQMNYIKSISSSISKSIKDETLSQLSGITNAFEKQIITLKTHTEGMTTSLNESENKIEDIKNQSERIIKDMVLSSSKMETLEIQSSKVYDTYLIMKEMINNIELVKSDYLNTQQQLIDITQQLKFSDDKHMLELKEQIDKIGISLNDKINESLEKLYEHYHLTTNEMSKNVELLSKKNKLKGYMELNDDNS